MATFLKSGPEGEISRENKAASKSAVPTGEPATTLRIIELGKPANDNPVPFAVRLRWWGPLILMAAAAIAWHFI
ncbi:MAG TPA: hypothetical protein VFS04_09945 [Alphaproteobacteria bacterium]|nr:hypothetical protein [Alphaproteobacteria bacterium]